jgi:hypothetical protein
MPAEISVRFHLSAGQENVSIQIAGIHPTDSCQTQHPNSQSTANADQIWRPPAKLSISYSVFANFQCNLSVRRWFIGQVPVSSDICLSTPPNSECRWIHD